MWTVVLGSCALFDDFYAVPCRVAACRAVPCSAVPCSAVQCRAVLVPVPVLVLVPVRVPMLVAVGCGICSSSCRAESFSALFAVPKSLFSCVLSAWTRINSSTCPTPYICHPYPTRYVTPHPLLQAFFLNRDKIFERYGSEWLAINHQCCMANPWSPPK